ncbi:MAG: RHS repeat-associated core domain-containing protein [Nitrospira defluvii]|nr:RHS repeat-associated core domain-containing protein [Nitrospira defluvii]
MKIVRHIGRWLLSLLIFLLVGAPAIAAADAPALDVPRGQTCPLSDDHDTILADMFEDGSVLIIRAIVLSITIYDYDDRLEGGGTGQTLTYTSGFSRERFSLQADGTYRNDRTPMLAGMIARRNQDGSSTLREKNGTVRTFGVDGWLRSITDRNGNTVTIVRSGSQIQQIIEPGGRALTFQYGGGGISQITDPLGRSVTYAYESEPTIWGSPRLRTVTNPAGGVTTYGYAVAFNIASITDARGITYLTNTYCSGTCPLDPAVVTQTMADSGVTQIDYVVTNRTVTQATVTDSRGKPTIHRFNTRSHDVGVVDALGQSTRTTRDFTTNQVTESRDPLNRPTKFTYDAAGNRIALLRANASASLLPLATSLASYDAANEQTAFAGATLTYDGNGNLTNDGVNTYQWDARNRLIAMSGGATATFAYDPLGRRASKTINGVATQFAYDGNDITVEISGGAVNTAYLRSLSIDEMFGIHRQDGAYFSIYDGLSSTLTLTNQSGTSAVQYTYEPFGKTQSSDPAFANPIQFTGRENDGNDFYYYRARYLSPKLQRFVSEDPIGLFGGDANLYAYVWSIPTILVDPHGLAGKRQEPHFDPYRHGGPHFDLPQGRYDAETLKPIPHKGVTPPELTRNEIQSLKVSKAYKQWLKFAKQAGKVGGIGLGIFLELVDPAEAGDPDLGTIDLGQRKTE